MRYFLVPIVLAMVSSAVAAGDDRVVFKSDVALTRVDAQVLDGDGRAITGLQAGDFVVSVDGRTAPIRNFANENMPMDILLLLDVSGSMQPHVERIASASEQALKVLSPQDRIAIMVFDTSTRVRLTFRNTHSDVTEELNRLLRSERFSRGTRITSALLDAAKYVQREGRPGTRRAIVILTDDQTQDEANEGRVESALTRANAVLSFLQAPYEVPGFGGGRRRGRWGHGGGWPGGIGFPGGGPVILGPGRGGPYGGGDRSHSAGTAAIASDSGGDTMQVENASAFEDTLARLRQRYELYFYLPEGAKSPNQQSVQVDLTGEARLRYRDAQTRSRRVYLMASDSPDNAAPVVVSQKQEPTAGSVDSTAAQSTTTGKRRRVAVNDDTGPQVDTVGTGNSGSSPQPEAPPAARTPKQGGWPRVDQQNPSPQ
jgi:hypothetical protein